MKRRHYTSVFALIKKGTAGICTAFALCLGASPTIADSPGGFEVETLVDLAGGGCPEANPAIPFHSGKLVAAPDRKLYFTSALEHAVYRVDENGVCEKYAQIPLDQIDPAASFSLGIAFDQAGHIYILNTGNLVTDFGSVWKSKKEKGGEVPVQLKRIWTNTVSGSLLTGMTHDKSGNLYVSDEPGGRIFKISDDENPLPNDYIWADSTEEGYELLAGTSVNLLQGDEFDPTNSTLFGVPFGVVELMVTNGGNRLYFTTQELGLLGRIEIEANGEAGVLREIAYLGDGDNIDAAEGAYLNNANDTIYLSAIFRNGTQLIPGQWQVGHRVYMVDVSDLPNDGTLVSPNLVSDDVRIGAPADIVSGENFGTGHADKLYVSDSSFDTFIGWPLGRLVSGDLCPQFSDPNNPLMGPPATRTEPQECLPSYSAIRVIRPLD